MENIIEPDEYFDFTKLSLAKPITVQGGTYFTKIEYNYKSLYIQTTKSLTKQGFIKSGKKYYCDLMFDKLSEKMINWFEKLEDHCQKLIFEKNSDWFQNSLEEDELSSAFNSIMRVYKSGKYYLVRCNIKNNHLGLPYVKIYDEKENTLTLSDVTNETNIISILEIQGIKFTKRNFQIEIELKQAMILDNEPFFDNCLIKSKKKDDLEILQPEPIALDNSNIAINLENNEDFNIQPQISSDAEFYGEPNKDIEITPIDEPLEEININFEELNEQEKDLDKPIDLNDIDFTTDLEPVQLKTPDQVYFNLYKEARNKAKLAKKNAILAFLEAKNIKKTYMIENIQDEDEDIDEEIEEASETDLEGF